MGHWGTPRGCRGCFRGVRGHQGVGCQGCIGADRDCWYSGARRGIGDICGH